MQPIYLPLLQAASGDVSSAYTIYLKNMRCIVHVYNNRAVDVQHKLNFEILTSISKTY